MEDAMFARVKTVKNNSYLQIVENRREGKSVKQRVVATLGHAEEFISSGKLDNLTRSLLKHTQAVKVIDAHREGSITARCAKSLGPALVFERLWKELGIAEAINTLAIDKRFKFSLERALFLTVLHRMFVSGSDRAAERWKQDFVIEGTDDIELHHLYRAMGWLGQRIIQLGDDPFTERTTKDILEESLFLRTRDLFSSLEMVFFDTTSLYFEGEGGREIGRRGHSKDSRPDLKQMIVGAILDGDGRPICCELWPGNVADVKTLLPIVERLKNRFGISSMCIVADRGMISKDTIEKLESQKINVKYILGVRMRKAKALSDVSFDTDSFMEVTPPKQAKKDPSPLRVSEKVIDGKKYILCYNQQRARKDKHDREAIVAALEDKLKESDKNLVGNNGFRKYLKSAKDDHFIIDEKKIAAEAKYDGMWVLTSNLQESPSEIARKYKELWMVEHVFRSMKSILDTRPIYHKCDETIRGHVFCSFLALKLMKELEMRLRAQGSECEWNHIKQDLSALKEVELEFDESTWYLRTDLRGCTSEVLKAAGVAVPPSLRK
jgi:transposase